MTPSIARLPLESREPRRRRRILFMAEAVTMAHVARPLALAQSLPSDRYEIHFACAEGRDAILADAPFARWPITTLPSDEFLRRLAQGAQVVDVASLEAAIEEDLRVLEAVQPELVVGDFRLSLAVSAALANVPYAAVTNAHWSPYSTVRRFPMPEHPLVDRVGLPAARFLFGLAQPIVEHLHGRAMNTLRRRHGLKALGGMRDAYTHADFTLFAATPELEPTVRTPSNHLYLGPVLWSPDAPLPPTWQQPHPDRPWVYVTLGSSGRVDVLKPVLEALASMPVQVAVATAGRKLPEGLPDTFHQADFLPGDRMARISQLVICNGGSATAYQSLAEGTPVLGIPSNMDQHLTMTAVVRAGAGALVRAGQANTRDVQHAATQLLTDVKHRQAAQRVAEDFKRFDARERFGQFVQTLVG